MYSPDQVQLACLQTSRFLCCFAAMQTELSQLKTFITALQPMSQKDLDQFTSLFVPLTAKRKAILTQSGMPERYLYFITNGVQRVYYQDENAREATLVFTYAPSFGGVLDAMLEQRNATFSYETLTSSTFLRAPYSEILALTLAPRTSIPLESALKLRGSNLAINVLRSILRSVSVSCVFIYQ
jgi:hypothetical protein